MAYILNKSDGSVLITLQDGVLDTTTSLGLVGRNYTGYGEVQNENFIFLLENFADSEPPARPIKGQAWFDTTNLKLNVYTGEDWVPVGTASVSNTQPVSVLGSFWVKESTNQLYVYTPTGWSLIGPEALEGFGKTRLEAKVLKDTNNINHAVLVAVVNNISEYIISSEAFTIAETDRFSGFIDLSKGITLSPTSVISGRLIGNADSATKLQTTRFINGVPFDGTSNITLTSSTTKILSKGDYIVGENFDGSMATSWSVDASPNNIIGKVVARDSTGSFSANIITANKFVGPLEGNVNISLGISTFDKIRCNSIEGPDFSGNASSASKLIPGAKINSVLFDGTQDITIPTAANSLTGNTLAANVLQSSLITVGTLNSLAVASPGIEVAANLKLFVDNGKATVEELGNQGLTISIRDTVRSGNKSSLRFINSTESLGIGGANVAALVPDLTLKASLGAPNLKFLTVYANVFEGEATVARYADLAENYVADTNYEPGTVLEFGGSNEVTLAKNETKKVAGVVSSNPAYLMNSACQGNYVVSLALQGRVPCKVTGTVKKGDILVSAGNGFAKACEDPKIGTVIGKSLQDFDGDGGVIEVAVGRL